MNDIASATQYRAQQTIEQCMSLFPIVPSSPGADFYRQNIWYFLEGIVEAFAVTGRPINVDSLAGFLGVGEPWISNRLLVLEEDALAMGETLLSVVMQKYMKATPAGVFLDHSALRHELGGLFGRLSIYHQLTDGHAGISDIPDSFLLLRSNCARMIAGQNCEECSDLPHCKMMARENEFHMDENVRTACDRRKTGRCSCPSGDLLTQCEVEALLYGVEPPATEADDIGEMLRQAVGDMSEANPHQISALANIVQERLSMAEMAQHHAEGQVAAYRDVLALIKKVIQ